MSDNKDTRSQIEKSGLVLISIVAVLIYWMLDSLVAVNRAEAQRL